MEHRVETKNLKGANRSKSKAANRAKPKGPSRSKPSKPMDIERFVEAPDRKKLVAQVRQKIDALGIEYLYLQFI